MTEATLIYRETVTLTVPPMTAWTLAVLLLMGLVSAVHTVLDWRDQLWRSLKGLLRRRTSGE